MGARQGQGGQTYDTRTPQKRDHKSWKHPDEGSAYVGEACFHSIGSIHVGPGSLHSSEKSHWKKGNIYHRVPEPRRTLVPRQARGNGLPVWVPDPNRRGDGARIEWLWWLNAALAT